ncbi:MAG: DegT/DnrJ/EryC1/StrS family aminotransferase [Candidatus Puniceispirillaceae bacterium]
MSQTVHFTKSFTQQEPIPEQGIERAIDILKSGRIHRYNLTADEIGETALLEADYAKWQGQDYCVATTSGGTAIQLALRAAGVMPGDLVLANAYTLAPVPGAIFNVGGKAVLVEIDHDYHIDIADLAKKAETSGAKFLLLSHMRGHIADMDAIMEIANHHHITVIEDCAHTMGAKWRGIRSGNFGHVAAFSTQTYKHMNSGEGGLLTTNDALIAAKATIMSGSYMLYERHGASPPADVFDSIRTKMPNFSCRLDHLRAAIIRAQMEHLDDNIARWNKLYQRLEANLRQIDGVSMPIRPQAEFYVGSSIQFRVDKLAASQIPDFLAKCGARGVDLKWFGADRPVAFTSRYDSWEYLEDIPDLPATKHALAKTIDMRVPLTFTPEDCDIITTIIQSELS